MGLIILVEGMPGTGKSAAIENLNPDETFIIKPNIKDLPWGGSRKMYNVERKNLYITNQLTKVGPALLGINDNRPEIKTVIIEDLTHFFSKRTMSEARTKGYDKWTFLAVDAYMNLLSVEEKLRDDLNVIIIGHTQISTDTEGHKIINLQTPGRLLEDQIKIPSYVTYILHTEVVEEHDGTVKYYFITNRNGSGKEAKSPRGCLDQLEPNDYKIVLDKIAIYQNGE